MLLTPAQHSWSVRYLTNVYHWDFPPLSQQQLHCFFHPLIPTVGEVPNAYSSTSNVSSSDSDPCPLGKTLRDTKCNAHCFQPSMNRQYDGKHDVAGQNIPLLPVAPWRQPFNLRHPRLQKHGWTHYQNVCIEILMPCTCFLEWIWRNACLQLWWQFVCTKVWSNEGMERAK